MQYQIRTIFQSVLNNEGIDGPIILSPLDTLSEDFLQKRILRRIENFADTEILNIVADYIQVVDSLNEEQQTSWMENEIQKRISDVIETEEFNNSIMDDICRTDIGGKWIPSLGQCSYKTKEECESSYSWPLDFSRRKRSM